jgi:hypothetical protein
LGGAVAPNDARAAGVVAFLSFGVQHTHAGPMALFAKLAALAPALPPSSGFCGQDLCLRPALPSLAGLPVRALALQSVCLFANLVDVWMVLRSMEVAQ